MSSAVLIVYDFANITDNVIFGRTTFTAKVNGQLGTADIFVRDIDHDFVPVEGKRIFLVIDSDVKWTGFVMRISQTYLFPAEDTTDAAAVVRVWRMECVDDNVLFDKRIVFDADNPATHIDFQYMPGAWDDDIINDIFDNYLDLSGDNIVRDGVTRVSQAILDIPGIISLRGTRQTLADFESTVHTGTIAAAGYTWGQAMDVIQRATGAIYYLDGVSHSAQRNLVYVDVETVTSDYALTDTPDLAIPLGGLPMDPPAVTDTFTRIDPSSLGTSDAGYAWNVPSNFGGGNAGTDGTQAVLTAIRNSVNVAQTLVSLWPFEGPAGWAVPFDIFFDLEFLNIPGGSSTQTYFQFTGDFSYGSTLRIIPTTGQALIVGGHMAGDPSSFASGVSVTGQKQIHGQIDGSGVRFNIWDRADPEPAGWTVEDTWGDTPTPDTYLSFLLQQSNTTTTDFTALIDNIIVRINGELVGAGGVPFDPPTATNRLNGTTGDDPIYGYRNFAIIENGSHLTNDMHIWGAALGAKLMVHSRAQDTSSLADHGRWVDGVFSNGLYRQATADLIADSWIDGTPQSHRGKKNDQLTFTCDTYMSVFRVGQVVAVANSIYGFAAALPLREMVIRFEAPDLPVFRLTLGHEIDQPWSFYESLRKMPRPIEIGIPRWVFPIPNIQICPLPTLAAAASISGGAMQSIFQRDFGGPTADPADPPLWQNPPYGGAWYTGTALLGEIPKSLTDTVPSSFSTPPTAAQNQAYGIDESGYGYVNGQATADRATLRLATPPTGAVEFLGACRFVYSSSAPANGTAIEVTLGPNQVARLAYEDGVLTLSATLSMEYVIVDTGLKGPGLYSATQTVPARLMRQSPWIRVIVAPNEGADGGMWIKVWPRTKKEPAAWTLVLSTGDIPTGPYDVFGETRENIAPWFSVIEDVLARIFAGSVDDLGGGFEAMAVYAEHGGDFPLHWDIFASDLGYGADGYFSPGSGPPGTYSTDFGGTYGNPGATNGFYFWGPEAGSFSEDRFAAAGAADMPNHVLTFAWPHFHFDPWDPAILYLAQVQQKIVSFKMGFTFPWNPDNSLADPDVPPIGFVQKLPDLVRIKGEVYVSPDSGGLFPASLGEWPPNLPWEVVLSFNYYGFGTGDPFWTTPYEALPIARHYVNYNPLAGLGEPSDDGRYWMPFEFDIPVAEGGYEAGDFLQWGCTFVGDIQDIWRTGLPVGTYDGGSGYPPGRSFLPNNSNASLVFRNVQYLASYLTDEVGAYFCVDRKPVGQFGDAIGTPAYDTGDELTYDVGSVFVPGSTSVWVNGEVQRYGATEDYTEVPADGQIVFNSPRDPDDEVIVDFAAIGAVLP